MARLFLTAHAHTTEESFSAPSLVPFRRQAAAPRTQMESPVPVRCRRDSLRMSVPRETGGVARLGRVSGSSVVASLDPTPIAREAADRVGLLVAEIGRGTLKLGFPGFSRGSVTHVPQQRGLGSEIRRRPLTSPASR